MYHGRGSKRAYQDWLRDMVMDTVGNEDTRVVTRAVFEKLERNTKPAPKRDGLRPWRTTNE